ncbi:MAG: hypothetical protein GY842_07955 [bacterium]|nr:hypothetical protein [bacterium]
MRKPFISVLLLAGLCLPFAALAGDGGDVIVGLQVGDQLTYQTTASPDADAEVTVEGQHRFIPFPETMEVVVAGEQECDGRTCLALEIEANMPPYRLGDREEADERTITALIDTHSGELLDVRTKRRLGQSTSTSTQGRFQRHTSLYHFYGAWMTDLRDEYTTSYTSRPSGTIGSIVVSGREKVDGNECFVVGVDKKAKSGQVAGTKIWVDVKRRVAVKLEERGRVMKLTGSGRRPEHHEGSAGR